MTKAERYTLSQGSGRLLKSMKQKMTVDVYVTRGLPKLDAFVRDLRDLLKEYKNASGGKFDYTLIEAKDDEEKKKAEDAGLKAVPFGEASEERTRRWASRRATWASSSSTAARRTSSRPLAGSVNAASSSGSPTRSARSATRATSIKHKVGVITGKDEMKLSEANLVPPQVGQALDPGRHHRATSPSTRSTTSI